MGAPECLLIGGVFGFFDSGPPSVASLELLGELGFDAQGPNNIGVGVRLKVRIDIADF